MIRFAPEGCGVPHQASLAPISLVPISPFRQCSIRMKLVSKDANFTIIRSIIKDCADLIRLPKLNQFSLRITKLLQSQFFER